ncbi:MAG: hypothetical protein QME64_12675, partial [bacterium]|nr:hypothetical protein [bacterium]
RGLALPSPYLVWARRCLAPTTLRLKYLINYFSIITANKKAYFKYFEIGFFYFDIWILDFF